MHLRSYSDISLHLQKLGAQVTNGFLNISISALRTLCVATCKPTHLLQQMIFFSLLIKQKRIQHKFHLTCNWPGPLQREARCDWKQQVYGLHPDAPQAPRKRGLQDTQIKTHVRQSRVRAAEDSERVLVHKLLFVCFFFTFLLWRDLGTTSSSHKYVCIGNITNSISQCRSTLVFTLYTHTVSCSQILKQTHTLDTWLPPEFHGGTAVGSWLSYQFSKILFLKFFKIYFDIFIL